MKTGWHKAFSLASTVLLSSCASVYRLPAKIEFKKKYINLSGEGHNGFGFYPNFYYDPDRPFGCFKNENGNEVITVNARHYEYAVDYLYKKKLAVDIKIRKGEGRHVGKIDEVKIKYIRESWDLKIEVASCFVEQEYSLLGISKNFDEYLKSFRFAK